MESQLIGGLLEFSFMKCLLVLILSLMKILWPSIKRFSRVKSSSQETLTSRNFSSSTNSLKPKIRDGKSLVKHLLVADLSKRYGNLKNGISRLLMSLPKYFIQVLMISRIIDGSKKLIGRISSKRNFLLLINLLSSK